MIWKPKSGADFLRLQQSVAPEQSDVDPDMLLYPDTATPASHQTPL
jgi:hypothetical protein